MGVLNLTVVMHCFLGGLTSNSKLSTSDSSSESLLLLSSLEADVDWVIASPKRANVHYFEVKNDVPENLCDPLYTLPYVKMMYCFELLFLDQLLTRIASTKAV